MFRDFRNQAPLSDLERGHGGTRTGMPGNTPSGPRSLGGEPLGHSNICSAKAACLLPPPVGVRLGVQLYTSINRWWRQVIQPKGLTALTTVRISKPGAYSSRFAGPRIYWIRSTPYALPRMQISPCHQVGGGVSGWRSLLTRSAKQNGQQAAMDSPNVGVRVPQGCHVFVHKCPLCLAPNSSTIFKMFLTHGFYGKRLCFAQSLESTVAMEVDNVGRSVISHERWKGPMRAAPTLCSPNRTFFAVVPNSFSSASRT